jgi:hypothetical protein
MEVFMTIQEFYDYFYKTYCEFPLAAQLMKQSNNIAHLKMEVGKLRKQIQTLSQNKEE